jgi:hypothetical protein
MLHPITGVKDNLLGAVQNAELAFTQNNAVVQQKLQQAFPDPVQREQVRQQIINKLGAAEAGVLKGPDDSRWFVPHDAMAGVAQSAMNNRAEAIPPAAVAPALAEAPFEQFGPLDPGWIECVVDGFKTQLEGKAPFVQHQNLTDFLYPINNQIKIAIVGDWGGHNDAAERVAAQIRATKPDMLIHLGDIYYAGQENEAEEALAMWPLADPATGAIPPGTSFSLNGNHEMFCGGRAFFETVFEAFGQKASYFGLRNASWQILAFDSAYVEHRLLPPEDAAIIDARLTSQWDWLVDKMRNSTLPTILLSHHEPVSAFTTEFGDGVNLRSDYQKFVQAAGRPVFGWIFGHEHLCTFYDGTIVPFARLIGHGCIPHTPPSATQADLGCTPFSKINTRANADGDGVSGFALLSFDGGSIDIRYIDEDGNQFAEEVWEAPTDAATAVT